MNETDVWKEIPNYPDYLVSDEGLIYSKRRKKLLKLDKSSTHHMIILRLISNILKNMTKRDLSITLMNERS